MSTISSCSVRALAAGLALGLPAMSAFAGVPAAMDRVPDEAVMVTSIRNLEEFVAEAKSLVDSLGIQDAQQQLAMAEMLLNTQGLDRDGSVALALMGDANGQVDFESDTGPLVVVVPVDNYADFVSGFGGSAEGLTQINAMGETMYAKDLGGGYAAMSPMQGLVSDFDGSAGRADAFEQEIGVTGNRVADRADAVVYADVDALRPLIEERTTEFKDNMQMFAMMAGQGGSNMDAQVAVMNELMDRLVGDAEIGFVGLDVEPEGVALDLSAQFAEGSDTASYFASGGHGTKLMNRVPDLPYLFAGGVDLSQPGYRKLIDRLMTVAKEAAPDGGMTLDAMKMYTEAKGISFVLGKPASIMGGVFTNSVAYLDGDSDTLREAVKVGLESMDGQSSQGMTTRSTFTAGDGEVNGAAVDTWSAKTELDPSNPQAAQMQMGLGMMWGPSLGPTGYFGSTDTGVTMTLAKNSKLMGTAMNAANAGDGLGTSDGMDAINAQLPESTMGNVYIGVGNIMKMVSDMAAMFGGEAPFDVKGDLPPIALGIAPDAGGVQTRLYIPQPVIATFAEIAQAQNGGGDWDDEDEDDARF